MNSVHILDNRVIVELAQRLAGKLLPGEALLVERDTLVLQEIDGHGTPGLDRRKDRPGTMAP